MILQNGPAFSYFIFRKIATLSQFVKFKTFQLKIKIIFLNLKKKFLFQIWPTEKRYSFCYSHRQVKPLKKIKQFPHFNHTLLNLSALQSQPISQNRSSLKIKLQ
jgi:hypothetical protein